MMELKEEGKVRGNTSSEQGGAVEMHVMERKPAWSQCTHLSVCKTAQAHILRYVFKDVVTVKSDVKLWCWCQTLCSMIGTWRQIKGVFTPFCLFVLVRFGWWVGGLGLLPACLVWFHTAKNVKRTEICGPQATWELSSIHCSHGFCGQRVCFLLGHGTLFKIV